MNRGVQINYNKGAFSGLAALSDGFYSGRLNWISGLVSYAINSKNSLSIVASCNIKHDNELLGSSNKSLRQVARELVVAENNLYN